MARLRQTVLSGATRLAQSAPAPVIDAVAALEGAELHIREWTRYLFARLPGDAEMAAILRRNGHPGFRAYVVGQMLGQFGRRCFLPADREAVVGALRQDHPAEAEGAIAAADAALRGEFDLLGSGVRDMRRDGGAGHRLDWRLEPISGERYARVFGHLRFDPMRMRRGEADVKGAWELSRCQHFAALGQAYWLTGDARYARCFAGTIDDFIRRNPPGNGVHWACTMDVALRVVGWLIGLAFFQGAPALGYRWWRRFLKSLLQHGRFIAANLEFGTLDGRVIVSNHGLADLFGLYWLALCFPGLDAGVVWRGIAEEGLEREVRRQLLGDGGDFESSLPYHRLVTEMFLSAYALSRHHGHDFSDGYRDRLLRALRLVRAVRRPDGNIPQIGDADNGRAHVLTGYGRWERHQESMDHLLAAGAWVFGCPALAEGISDAARAEGLFWRDPADPPPVPCTIEPVANPCLFPDTGLGVLRAGPSYVAMSNGVCGTLGIGNHKHNDQLALEWCVGEQPLLVDGGSYTYTMDPAARNLFRATAQHNTVMVAGAEQNTFEPEALFRMVQQGEPGWDAPLSAAEAIGIGGAHTAYARLAPPVRHGRRVTARLADGLIVLDDLFTNGGAHCLRWHFLVHPGVQVDLRGDAVRLSGPAGAGLIKTSPRLGWRTESGWYSPGYGRRERTTSLVAELDPGCARMTLCLVPLDDPVEEFGAEIDCAALAGFADRAWRG